MPRWAAAARHRYPRARASRADNVTAFRRPRARAQNAAAPSRQPASRSALIFICLVVVYVGIRYSGGNDPHTNLTALTIRVVKRQRALPQPLAAA
jgi:hypothetical protein